MPQSSISSSVKHLPPLNERVTETEDNVCVCYRINLPEIRNAEDIRIRTVHESSSTPINEDNYRKQSTTGITIVAENDVFQPDTGDQAKQTLTFELRLPPQAKRTAQIRAFWREDSHQVVIIIQKEGQEIVYKGLLTKYAAVLESSTSNRNKKSARNRSGSKNNGSYYNNSTDGGGSMESLHS